MSALRLVPHSADSVRGCDDRLVAVDDELEFDQLTLWRADSIVLFDWLRTVDLDKLPMTNRAQQQALSDLLSALEVGANVFEASAEDVASAQAQVWRDDGWLARFDDGPLAGDIRTVERDPRGVPPLRLSLPDPDPAHGQTTTAHYAWDGRTDHADGFHYRIVDN